MKPHSSARGIVVLCDLRGVITKVIHDGLGLTLQLEVGQPFIAAIGVCQDESLDSKTELAREFMETLCSSGYAFGWQIPVLIKGESTDLSFTGGVTDEGVLVVGNTVGGTANRNATRLVEALMRINNDTVNSLRAALKQAAASEIIQNERDDEFLAELSRANNDVLTAQRELAKKNAMLIHTTAALEEAQTASETKQAALEKANLRLDALATMDGLTEVSNRRAFGEKLAEEMTRSLRENTPLSLLLLDVDKFKQFNDTFGHQAGDRVLQTVARLLREQARMTDSVARYGGEEFALVLPNTDAKGALLIAERLRVAIEVAPWPERAVTASFGAATLSLEVKSETELIATADRALYAAKESGRNRVTHAQDLGIMPVEMLAQTKPNSR